MYDSVKKESTDCNADIWPCYDTITQERKNCRPPSESYEISGQVAQFSFKELAKTTVDRILKIKRIRERIQQLKNKRLKDNAKETGPIRLKCHIKCGFDG